MEKQKCPELRFKGFDLKWEKNVLGDITSFINGRAYSQEELLKKGKYPVLRVGNFNTNSHWYYSDLELGDKYYAEDGDLLYTWSTIFSPYIWKGEKVIYHYHIWKVELSKKLNKLFAFHFLKADESALTNNTNGSTMIHITKGEMESKTIHIPLLDEQEKIGLFFESLKTKINLQEKKLNQTQNLKKAMLEKMFPKAGSTQPEIRLKGFSGDWEAFGLFDVALYKNGKSHESDVVVKGKYIIVNSKFISTDGVVRKFCDSQIEPLLKNDIVFVLSDVPNGKALSKAFLIDVDGKYTLNQRIACLTPDEQTDAYFLYVLINRNPYFLKFDDGVGQTNLSLADMENFIALYPCAEEQKTIGQFFKQLDETLVLQQQQLQTLKNLKQAFLEKMFV